MARADGVVADAELERLSRLFYHLTEDLVSASEVDLWLEEGPPPVPELLPAELRDVFLFHAREIIVADREVAPEESALVRELLHTYFRAA